MNFNSIVVKLLRFLNFYYRYMTNCRGVSIRDNKGIPLTVKKKYQFFNCFSIGNNVKERIPNNFIKSYGKRFLRLNKMLPSREICFETDENELTFIVVYKDIIIPSCMSLNGACGLDIYLYTESGEYKWITTISPKNQIDMYLKKTVYLEDGKKRILVYFPSYATVSCLNVKIRKNRSIGLWNERIKQDKIVAYGSSITQGCASSRPGASYLNILGRKLNMPILNYGYSESAKAQKNVIEYISCLHSKIYIIEYDHNASIDLLRKTHFELYNTIRKENKNAIIIFMSRFSGGISITLDEANIRSKIINDTCCLATNAGDKNVLFLNGLNNLSQDKELFFADDRHPNDRGMYAISSLLAGVIEGYIDKL